MLVTRQTRSCARLFKLLQIIVCMSYKIYAENLLKFNTAVLTDSESCFSALLDVRVEYLFSPYCLG